MITNQHFGEIPESYLFSEVAERVRRYEREHPGARVLRLGIGDVTRPLAPAIIGALHRAVEEQTVSETFRGYGPEAGYEFLREAIAREEYAAIGVEVGADEIFIGDGSKSDSANLQELFAASARVAVTDPVYPVYVDSNAMAGRLGTFDGQRWSRLTYLHCSADNGYRPALPETPVDLIYLCSPNNPTGTTLSRDDLEMWVQYAQRTNAVIIYDVAYRAFITGPEVPRSIYEIPGADEVAIELGSFSKSAGFTGLRCSWTVVPKKLVRDGAGLNAMWLRRQSSKFNGTPYIVQRAAEATYSAEGRRQMQQDIDGYLGNARLIRTTLQRAGLRVVGGEDSPYVWLQCPEGMGSWAFFDALLSGAEIVGTPGAGFGPSGDEGFRLSAFNTQAATREASERLSAFLPTLLSAE